MSEVSPGWYGKLPMLGDFASRRLPQAFIETCDDWLSNGIEASRQRLGDAWLNTYLTGPLWRFAWAPPVVDARWWFGVLMPSVDKVGRYFPLVVAWASASAPIDAEALRALDELQARMANAALASLRANATLDDFESALESPLPYALACAEPALSASELPGRQRFEADVPRSLLQWAQALSSVDFTRRLAGHSLWWLDPGSTSEHRLSIAPGLPPAEHFVDLLQRDW